MALNKALKMTAEERKKQRDALFVPPVVDLAAVVHAIAAGQEPNGEIVDTIDDADVADQYSIMEFGIDIDQALPLKPTQPLARSKATPEIKKLPKRTLSTMQEIAQVKKQILSNKKEAILLEERLYKLKAKALNEWENMGKALKE